MLERHSCLVIRGPGPTILLTQQIVDALDTESPSVVVWDHAGLFGVLSWHVVDNAVKLWKDLAKRPSQAPKIPARWLWTQTVSLAPAAAEALGLKSDR